MDGRIEEGVDGWMDKWKDGWLDGGTDGGADSGLFSRCCSQGRAVGLRGGGGGRGRRLRRAVMFAGAAGREIAWKKKIEEKVFKKRK